MSNLIFYALIVIFTIEFIWGRFLSYLNKSYLDKPIPDILLGIYDQQKYNKQQEYSKTNYKFSFISSSFNYILIMTMLLLGGFRILYDITITISSGLIFQTIFYIGVLSFVSTVLNLPFSIYDTFVIEEKFGFNKTSVKTFILDLIKSFILMIVLGGGLLVLVTYFYISFPEYYWLYAWVALTVFSVLLSMFYTSVILPLFNKQTPLEDGELKTSIEDFAKKVDFKLDNIYVMDGSKRSTKANAFFSGLGHRKRIVLYDTLINELKTKEIVAVLAHEIGHYKHKHTFYSIVNSIIQSGIMLFILSLCIDSPLLSEALNIPEPTFYVGLIMFGILYSPISGVTQMLSMILSRKNEYQADAFAHKHGFKNALISALKKLSSNSLSNLTPHPWYVFFNYSHPSLEQRVRRLIK